MVRNDSSMQALRVASPAPRRRFALRSDNGNSPGVGTKRMTYAESTAWFGPVARAQCGAATMVLADTGTASGGAATYIGLIGTGQ